MFKVTATSLNIRSQPKLNSRYRLAVLPNGQIIRKINTDHTPWWLVNTTLRGHSLEGYVHSNYLEAINDNQPQTTISHITSVHLKENRSDITRSRDGGRAYPLGESGQPERDGSGTNQQIIQLGNIINWLGVDQSIRYQRKGSTTYCNIYAYDYCYLAGVYIPRVWWKEHALLKLSQGIPVEVQYGSTVRELNANALHDWFEDFGADFGWQPGFDITQCQQAANQGKVVIACAKRVTTNRPGHICAIVPETSEHSARRRSNGEVSQPLQSQAGGTNFLYKTANQWWLSNKFQSFGLWIHD